MKIVLNVTYKGDKTVNFVKEVKESGLLDNIRNEAGNLQYEYFTSLDNPNNLLLVECWANAYDLSRHSQGEYIKKIGELKEKYGLTSIVNKFMIDN